MKLSKRIRAWLQLLRIPNLMTVPGDPIAGYLISGGVGAYGLSRVAPLALSSICFYCFGLIMNDIADLGVDREERPDRPLPSGAASVAAAKIVCIFFLVWGLAMAWLTSSDTGIVASALAVAVISYNCLLKKRPLAGPFSMGACRGLSLMMGAAAGGGVDYRVALAVAGLTLYVAAFSSIARLEMKSVVFGIGKWFPALVLMLMFAIIFTISHKSGLEMAMMLKPAIPAVLAIGLAFMCGRRLIRPNDVPAVIGGFVANMMLVQAALCSLAGSPGQIIGGLIACMIPLFVLLSLRFYSS
jgi:4-hydroxybenzoate polyprenyltransferase